jgi:hypothetical protein
VNELGDNAALVGEFCNNRDQFAEILNYLQAVEPYV